MITNSNIYNNAVRRLVAWAVIDTLGIYENALAMGLAFPQLIARNVNVFGNGSQGVIGVGANLEIYDSSIWGNTSYGVYSSDITFRDEADEIDDSVEIDPLGRTANLLLDNVKVYENGTLDDGAIGVVALDGVTIIRDSIISRNTDYGVAGFGAGLKLTIIANSTVIDDMNDHGSEEMPNCILARGTLTIDRDAIPETEVIPIPVDSLCSAWPPLNP